MIYDITEVVFFREAIHIGNFMFYYDYFNQQFHSDDTQKNGLHYMWNICTYLIFKFLH